jgi:tetratricopeptide (TPR) repeat protein
MQRVSPPAERLLVGREGPLAALAALLADARHGRGRAALVLGEAGIGKTSLADGVAELAAGQGFRVGWGRCPESDAPPYWPWSQALRPLGVDLSRLVESPHGGSRASHFASVVDHLATATAEHPALLVVDDVHWADAPSVALLAFVASAVAGLPLVLLATARGDDIDESDETALALRRLPTAVQRIALAGLDLPATAAVVEHVTGTAPAADVVADVHRRTGGNPFFVTEVARLHVLRGRATAVEVPPGVRQVVSRRLARLSQPAAELLAAAAVLGEPDPRALSAMTGQDQATVLGLLDEALRARVVAARDDGLAFSHALVRETVYADLGPATRASLHRAAATMLESRDDAEAGDLAAHWTRAGGDDAARAAAYALEAAGNAMARMGYEQAVRYYRWALDGGAGDGVSVRIGLGEAQVLSGDLSAGRETLREAARMAAAAGRGEDLARAVLLMGTGVGGFEVDLSDEQQPALLRQALDLLPPHDSALRAATLARLSLALAGRSGTAERAAMARQAADMARGLGDRSVEVSALAAVCDSLAGPDDVEQRLADTARMVELASAGDDPMLLLLARRLRLVALLETGDLAAVDAEIFAYARTSDRLRVALYAWPVPIWRGMRAEMSGDRDAAWRHLAEAEELARRTASVNAELMVLTLRMWLLRRDGRAAEMIPVLAARELEMMEYVGADCLYAVMHAEGGRPEDARRHLRRMLARGLESLPRDSEWLEYLWMLADAAMILDEGEAMQAVHELLRPYAHLWAVDGMGGACFGKVATLLDRLGARLGTLSPTMTETSGGTFRREGRVWRLHYRGIAATVPDSKGMADLGTLLRRPGEEVHVLELVEAAGGPALAVAAAEGDTGPVLDSTARAAYADRLRDLETEIAAARAAADAARVEALRSEADFIAGELERALGLGGRPRVTGDRVEKARKAVAMRIATAMRTIEADHPALGRHLRVSVRTGRFCSYRPEHPLRWQQ